MLFVHPHFGSSDKTKNLALQVIVLGVLVVVFRIYSIPVEKIPFLELPLVWTPRISGVPVLGISTILAVVTIFQYLSLFGNYVGEVTLFNIVHLNQTDASVKSFPTAIVGNLDKAALEQELRATNIAIERSKHDRYAQLACIIRVLTDIGLPTLVTFLALWSETVNIIAVVRVLF